MSDVRRQTYLPTTGADPATGAAAAFARVELPGGCRDLLRAVAELQSGRPEWTGPRRELAGAAGCAVDTVTRRTKVCVEAGYLDYVSRSGRSCTWSVRAADVIDRPHRPRRPEPAPAEPRRRAAREPVAESVAAPPPAAPGRGAQLREGWATLRRGVVLIVAALLWPRPSAATPAPRPGERRGDAFQPFLFAEPPTEPAPTAAPAAAPALSTGGAGAAAPRRRSEQAAPVSTPSTPVSTPAAPVPLPTKQAVSAAGAPGGGAGVDTGAAAAPAAPPQRTQEPKPIPRPTPNLQSKPIEPMGALGSERSSGGGFYFGRTVAQQELTELKSADRLYREAAASPLTTVKAGDAEHRRRFLATCLSVGRGKCDDHAGVLTDLLNGGRSKFGATWMTRGAAKDLERVTEYLKRSAPPVARAATAPAAGVALPDLTPRTGVTAADRERQLAAFRTARGAEYLAGVSR